MPEETSNTLRFRVLRYTPNLVRDEWVNVGVLLEEVDGPRRAMRLIEDALRNRACPPAASGRG